MGGLRFEVIWGIVPRAMTKADPEVRTVTLNLRTTRTIKKMVETLSIAEERSIAQTVERLIKAEIERRGLAPAKKKTRT
jgi:hypothetical protein